MALEIKLNAAKTGFEVIGTIPFDGDEGFDDEKEGLSYNVPLKARGNAEGKLFIKSGKVANKNTLLKLEDFGTFDPATGRNPEYDALPVIKDGKKDMYVMYDGTLTTDPFSDAAGRNIKATVVKVPRKASDKRFFTKNIKDATLTWPDGKVRDLHIEIKANNAAPPEEYEARKAQATQRRQATNVATVLQQDSGLLADAVVKRMRSQNKPDAAIRMVLEAQGLPVPDGIEAA